MGIHTDIEYSDSTLNLMMGCDGCELWNPAAGVKDCYAGVMTEHYGGRKGWPKTFDQPELFVERLNAALRWSDLTGKDRPDKPWLNGLPRIVFLNDMGDTFTESLPINWLAPLLPRIADSPHQYLLLTKRPDRMAKFSAGHPLPPNVWPGASVTSAKTVRRIGQLGGVCGGGPRWLSCEPLLGTVRFGHWPYYDDEFPNSRFVDWCVGGGASGATASPMHPNWARLLRDQCGSYGISFLWKQWGEFAPSAPRDTGMMAVCEFCGWSGEISQKAIAEHRNRARGGCNGSTVAMYRVGKHAAGRLLDGREWSEMPRSAFSVPLRDTSARPMAIVPEGDSNLAGALVAECVRDIEEYRSLRGFGSDGHA